MLKILCVLKSGGDYDLRYVQNLKTALDRTIGHRDDWRLICFTDMDVTIPGVDRIPLKSNLEGWWSKVEIFQQTGACLYLDLDSVLISDFSSIFTTVYNLRRNEFIMLRPFNNRRKRMGAWASGIMAWNGDWSSFFHSFRRADLNLLWDQRYVARKLAESHTKIIAVQDVLPGVYSYKRQCLEGIPAEATIICFHGNPRPHQVPSISMYWDSIQKFIPQIAVTSTADMIPDAETISIIVPTRKRTKDLARLLLSIIDTAEEIKNVEICARVDVDDPESIMTLVSFADRVRVKISVGLRQVCHGNLWNDAWRICTGDVLQMSSDDFVYRTKGWDKEVLKEINKFPDKIAFVYGEDGFQHGKLGTHFFIHKRWAEAIGGFVQMHTNVFYHDTWNDVLATKVGRRVYRPDLMFEHLHWAAGKSVRDDVTKEAKKKSHGDTAIWDANWQGPAMQQDYEKLKAVMYE